MPITSPRMAPAAIPSAILPSAAPAAVPSPAPRRAIAPILLAAAPSDFVSRGMIVGRSLKNNKVRKRTAIAQSRYDVAVGSAGSSGVGGAAGFSRGGLGTL